VSRIQFGVDVLCHRCGGSGGIHSGHLEIVGYQQDPITKKEVPIKKRQPCREHPCTLCKGRGTLR
jgi:hypothetical protein